MTFTTFILMGAFTFYHLDATNTDSVTLNTVAKSVSFTHVLKSTLLSVVLIFESEKLCKDYFNFLKAGHGVSISPKSAVVKLETASPGTVVEGMVFENNAPRAMALRGDIIPHFVGTAKITVEHI